MALDLGTLVGHLEIDPTRAKAGIAEGEAAIDRFEKTGKAKAKTAGGKVGESLGEGVRDGVKREESAIRGAGEDAGESFGDGVKSKIAALGLGAAVTAGLMEGLDLDAAGDKLVASLGAQHKRGEKLTRIATDIYKGAWGESVDEVNLALGSVVTSMAGMRKASEKELTKATTKALDFAATFDVDVARSVQVAGTLMHTGLAKNATEAFDLLTRGSQKVPVQLREDLQDASEEYGQFFAGLGYSGGQAFAMLVDGAEKGVYGIDKVGDAVKEFTIRSTDMSKATNAAYELIGLNAEKMTEKILKGGDDAQEATRKIVDGLLSIESPSARANAAIALFGTPLEDLNVNDIPDFLRNMRGMSGRMDDFRGASKRMGDELNDNAKVRVEAFTREVKTGFVQWFAKTGIPFIEDDLIPAVKGMADAFDDMPSWAVKGTAGGLLGALLLGKVGNVAGNIGKLGGMLKGGGALGKVGKAGAVPVWVVNSLPGTPTGTPGGGKPGVPPVATLPNGDTVKGVGRGSRFLKFAPLLPAAGALGNDQLPDLMTDKQADDWRRYHANINRATDFWLHHNERVRNGTIPLVDATHEKFRDLFGVVKDVDKSDPKVTVAIPGYNAINAFFDKLKGDLEWVSRPRYIRLKYTSEFDTMDGRRVMPGVQERAGGGPVVAGMPYIVGEREPELFVPNTSGRILNQRQMAEAGVAAGGDSGRLAPLMQDVTIKLTDMRDVERYARSRQRVAAGGGVNF